MDLHNCVAKHENLIKRTAEGKYLALAFGINESFIPQLGVMIISILKNNRNINFHLYIFIDEISAQEKDKIKNTVGAYTNSSLTICIVNSDVLSSVITNKDYPKATFYRLIAAKYLEEFEQHVLYLDADTLCMGALDVFCESENFSKKIFWACLDSGEWLRDHKKSLGMKPENNYFNAGVMYINLKEWNQVEASERMVELLQVKHFSLLDQDAINVILSDEGGILPVRYNQFYKKNKVDNIKIPDDTVIVHFAGAIKPWQYWCNHPIKLKWEEIKNSSEWKGYQYKIKNYQENRIMARKLRKEGRGLLALKWYGKYVINKIKEKWM